MASTGPKFVSRDRCIACQSGELTEVAGGHFRDEPLGSFIAGDPWGENPLPILADERWSLGAFGHYQLLDSADSVTVPRSSAQAPT